MVNTFLGRKLHPESEMESESETESSTESNTSVDNESGSDWDDWDVESGELVRNLVEARDSWMSDPQTVKEILSSEEFCSKNQERKKKILDLSKIIVWSANEDHFDLVKDIVELGGDPNLQDSYGSTVLMLASMHGNSSMVSFLVHNGSEVNGKSSQGKTALMTSHENGHYAISVLLLQLGADIKDDKDQVNHKDENGWTLLHRAVDKGDEKVVNLILSQSKPDISLLNQDLQTAFLLAKDLNQKEIANLIEPKETKNGLKKSFFEILKSHCVQSKSCCRGLEVLLSKLRMKLEETNDKVTCLSALALAAKNGHSQLLKNFLHKNSNWLDDNNPPLIWQASNSGQHETLQVLLTHEKMVKKWKEIVADGTNSLTVALLKKNTEIIDLMLNCDQIQKDEIAQELCTQFGQLKIFPDLPMNVLYNCRLALKSNDVQGAEKLLKKLHSDQKNEFQLQIQDDEIHLLNMRRILNLSTKQKPSDLVQLTEKFPVMNDKIEDNAITLEIDRFYEYPGLIIPIFDEEMLGEFCCIDAHKNETKSSIIQIQNVNTSNPCSEVCLKMEECQSISHMIKLCQLLEEKMKQKIPKLQPRFILLGSIAEGTRIGKATELDVMVRFEGLRNSPLTIKDNAAKLLTIGVMNQWAKNGIFSYSKFLEWFLQKVKECLHHIRKDGKIPESIKLFCQPFDPHSCQKCLEERKLENVYTPYTHCLDHLTSTTTTKLGACLIFKWEDRIQSIDLIPVFPIESRGTFHLFNLMISTLIQKQYPNWLVTCHKIMNRDIILPEAFGHLKEYKSTTDIGIKILNYGSSTNYIIRPAQEMNIETFHENSRIKEVYNHIKVIINGLQIDVKSYFVKKILTLPDFNLKAEKENASLDRLLFDALSHPELKKVFSAKIDFDKWQRDLIVLQDSILKLPLHKHL